MTKCRIHTHMLECPNREILSLIERIETYGHNLKGKIYRKHSDAIFGLEMKIEQLCREKKEQEMTEENPHALRLSIKLNDIVEEMKAIDARGVYFEADSIHFQETLVSLKKEAEDLGCWEGSLKRTLSIVLGSFDVPTTGAPEKDK